MSGIEAVQEAERTWDRRSRFVAAALRRWLTRRQVALVISGGGSQGSFQAGALRFLYDHLALRPVAICGNSVGAVIGAKLAEGDDPATGQGPMDSVEMRWRSMRNNEDFWRAEPWLEKLRNEASWAAEFRDHLADHGTSAAQVRVVLRMVGGLVRHAPVADGTIDALRQALRAKSLLSMAPIHQLVAEHLDADRVAGSGIKLRLGTVSLESGELRYVTEAGELVSRDNVPLGLPNVDLHEAVVASASIPVMFPPVRLGDEHYVDGGVRELLPLDFAFQHLGADHIYAVVASALGVTAAPSFQDKGLLDVARRVTTEIGPDEILYKTMHPPRGWGRRVTLIAPEFDVHDALLIDPDLIAASIDYGYMRAAEVVLNLGDDARRTSAEIARTRMALRELEGPVNGLIRPAEQIAPLLDEEGLRAQAERRELLQARLAELVDERRRIGAPLPPAAVVAPADNTDPQTDEPEDLGVAELG
jgi:predicted acylesterase/phospholipase RssA